MDEVSEDEDSIRGEEGDDEWVVIELLEKESADEGSLKSSEEDAMWVEEPNGEDALGAKEEEGENECAVDEEDLKTGEEIDECAVDEEDWPPKHDGLILSSPSALLIVKFWLVSNTKEKSPSNRTRIRKSLPKLWLST